MLWSGRIKIIKIIKLEEIYVLNVDVDKSVETFKNLSSNYKEVDNKEVDNKEIVLKVKLNPLMLCNLYDKFKIKTTKKFIDIDFSNSNVFIKLDINDLIISVKTMTKTETQVNNKVNGKTIQVNGKTIQVNGETIQVNGETIQVNGETKRINRKTNTSIRKRFVSDLIGICKKIDLQNLTKIHFNKIIYSFFKI
jgi:hypothetical protein